MFLSLLVKQIQKTKCSVRRDRSFFFKGDEMGSVLGALTILFLHINKYLVIIKVLFGNKKNCTAHIMSTVRTTLHIH